MIFSITQHNLLITDRVRSTTGRLCFDTCLSVCLSTGVGTPARSRWREGYPSQVQLGGHPWWGGGGTLGGGYPPQYPHQTWLGVPHLRYPPVRPGRGGGIPEADNRWGTWYGAVGMPLAFTQEDFFVKLKCLWGLAHLPRGAPYPVRGYLLWEGQGVPPRQHLVQDWVTLLSDGFIPNALASLIQLYSLKEYCLYVILTKICSMMFFPFMTCVSSTSDSLQ